MMLLGMGGAGFDFGDEAYRFTNVLQTKIYKLLLLCIHFVNRDVFLQGTCDDGVKELAKRLGWEVRVHHTS